MASIGIDGCRGGWLVTRLDSMRISYVAVVPRIETILDAAERERVPVGVDMPIGLLDGPRACDHAARVALGARRASVFAVPCRAVIEDAGLDWPAALARSRELTGRGISKQVWNLVPRIRELDRAMTPQRQGLIVESHPELCFTALAGTPCVWPKRRPEGRAERAFLLAEAGLPDPGQPPAGAAVDDLHDALALALAAARRAEGAGRELGDGSVDARGLRCSIWW